MRAFLIIMLLDCLKRDLYTTIGWHWGCLTQKGDIGVLPQQLRNKFFDFLKHKVKHPAWLKLLHWARRTWGDAGEVPGGAGGEADALWTWIGGPWILIGGGAVLPLDAAGGGKVEETSLKKWGDISTYIYISKNVWKAINKGRHQWKKKRFLSGIARIT